jgi:hypothetical protein
MPKNASPVCGTDRSATTSPFTRSTADPTTVSPNCHSPVACGVNVPTTVAEKDLTSIPGAGSSIHMKSSRSVSSVAVASPDW